MQVYFNGLFKMYESKEQLYSVGENVKMVLAHKKRILSNYFTVST